MNKKLLYAGLALMATGLQDVAAALADDEDMSGSSTAAGKAIADKRAGTSGKTPAGKAPAGKAAGKAPAGKTAAKAPAGKAAGKSKAVTEEDCKLLVVKKVDEVGKEAVIALLKKFGATKVPNLDKSKYKAFYTALEGLKADVEDDDLEDDDLLDDDDLDDGDDDFEDDDGDDDEEDDLD